VTIEIPQDSFRLYFRDIPDMPFGWLKLKHGDIVCDKTLILSFLDEAIEKHLIWTMDQITIYYIRDLTVAGLEKGVLNDVDRFDVIYKNSKPLPKKMDIDALIAMMRGEES